MKFEQADERAKAEIAKLELPDGGVVRVGQFRITRSYRPARSVEPFEVRAGSILRIAYIAPEG